MTSTIKCADCGTLYETIRKNTKRCYLCQIIQNAQYHSGRTITCKGCDQEFCPLTSGGRDWCGACYMPSARHDTEGKCVFCKQQSSKLIHPDAAVCRGCATSPEHHDLFVKALIKKVRERTHAPV